MFGNFALGSIAGSKFNDLNGDIAWEQGEPTLSGWTIQLWNSLNGQPNQIIATDVTDNSGTYSFGDLEAGLYWLTEVNQTGWTQTTHPLSPVLIQSGSVEEQKDFGNFQDKDMTGMKWNDLNGNGQKDPNEPGLAGWTIQLWSSCTQVFADYDYNGNTQTQVIISCKRKKTGS